MLQGKHATLWMLCPVISCYAEGMMIEDLWQAGHMHEYRLYCWTELNASVFKIYIQVVYIRRTSCWALLAVVPSVILCQQEA